jgi:hypothetical protein
MGGSAPHRGRPSNLWYFWENYGATPIQALLGMVRQPREVLFRTVTSGFFEPIVLVQSGLFPHAGYDQRFLGPLRKNRQFIQGQ